MGAEKAEEEMYGTACDISAKESNEIFEKIDTNHNGYVGGAELKTALEAYAKSQNHVITKHEKRWLKHQFIADSNHGRKGLGEKEFHEFANTVANKFDLCGAKK